MILPETIVLHPEHFTFIDQDGKKVLSEKNKIYLELLNDLAHKALHAKDKNKAEDQQDKALFFNKLEQSVLTHRSNARTDWLCGWPGYLLSAVIASTLTLCTTYAAIKLSDK